MEDLRILLWDIDGTLIRSVRPGGFKEYTIPVMESVFGTAGRLPEMTVSGMTDLQIVAEALRDEGFTRAEMRRRVRELRARYLAELERVTAAGRARTCSRCCPACARRSRRRTRTRATARRS